MNALPLLKHLLNRRNLRAVARVLVATFLTVWYAAPVAAASRQPVPPERITHVAPRDLPAGSAHPLEERELTEAEMASLFGRGDYRNRAFSGVLPGSAACGT
jgi:hypothetical protein